jgi:hypothetical protein
VEYLWADAACSGIIRPEVQVQLTVTDDNLPGWRLRLFSCTYAELAVQFLLRELPRTPDSLGLLAGTLFRRFFIMLARTHFAKNALLLQFLLQKTKRLIDIVVSNKDLQAFLLIAALGGGESSYLQSGGLGNAAPRTFLSD